MCIEDLHWLFEFHVYVLHLVVMRRIRCKEWGLDIKIEGSCIGQLNVEVHSILAME